MKKGILVLILAIVGFMEFGCKKNSGGPPTITGIRVVDSTKRDSLFVKGYPGNLIVINGANLNDAQAVFFNDTAAYFNPVYNTSTHLIVSIPASAQTAATRPNVPNVLRVVTPHGSVNYTFTLVEPPPFISSLSFDNTGSIVFIKGANFEGIKKITFPGGDTALAYLVNKAYNTIAVLIPPNSTMTDSIRVYVTYGVASFGYPPPMSVTAVSDENAVPGDTITLTGTNFIGIHQVIFPGNIVDTNIIPIDVNHLSVVVPMGVSTTDTLRIKGTLGMASATQLFDSYITHPSPGYLCTFSNQYSSDNTGFVGWTGGYANAAATATTYPGGSGGSGVLIQSSPMPGNTKAGSQGNQGLLQLSDYPWVANPAASINGYSMKFEVFVKKPWKAGAIWISVGDWYSWRSYTAEFAPWMTAPGGVYQPRGWTTITIPLTQFITLNEFYQNAWNPAGVPAKVFTDYPTTGVGFLMVNDQPSPNIPANTMNIAIENVRVVQGQ